MSKTPKDLKFLIASFLSIFFEYFDFIIYAHLAMVFSYKFFPTNIEWLTSISGWIPFFIGFLSRPIGSILFGYIADKYSSQTALVLSSFFMGLATVLIGLLPSYEKIGLLAPISLICLRVIQGIAIAPEYNGPSVYFLSNNLLKNYNLKCSINMTAITIAMSLSGILVSKITGGYNLIDLPEYRWRMVFVALGTILGGVTLLLRLSVAKESIAVQPMLNKEISNHQINYYDVLLGLIVSAYVGMIFYTFFGFYSAYMQKFRPFGVSNSISIISYATLMLIPANLCAGWLADRWGCVTVMKLCCAIMFFVIFYSNYTLILGNYSQVRQAIFLYAFLSGFFAPLVPGFLANLYPKNVRFILSCVTFNFGMALFGGVTPIMMASLIKINVILPSVVFASISALVFMMLHKIDQQKLSCQFI